MSVSSSPGQIVILNGAPRSGKSSIAAAIQETFPGDEQPAEAFAQIGEHGGES